MRFPTFGLYLKFDLYRISLYAAVGLDRFHCKLKNKKSPHGQNSSKFLSANHRNRDKIDTLTVDFIIVNAEHIY